MWNNPNSNQHEQLGCLCNMDFAAGILWKDCYIFEKLGEGRSDGIGWELPLNGTIIKSHDRTN